jgi:1-acyl-sn-glycerol-3-phosphate acyltransferase
MKKDWFFFPLGYFFRAIGGVPVDRSRRTDLVEQIVEQFNAREKITIAITPEATRKANPNWKTGFYRIALGAKVPIVLAYLDYDKREVGIERTFTPTGDVDADMEAIKRYYMKFNGKYKDKFVTGLEK